MVHAGPYPQKITTSIGNEMIWGQTGLVNIGFGTYYRLRTETLIYNTLKIF